MQKEYEHQNALNFNSLVFLSLIVTFLNFSVFFPAVADENMMTNKSNETSALYEKGWFYLTQMHVDKQALNKAIDVIEKVKKIDPGNKDIYWKLAEITFKMADDEKDVAVREKLYEKIIQYSENTLELNPLSLEAHYWKGCANARLAEITGVFSALGRVKDAKKELNKTIETDNNHRYSIHAKAVLAAIYTVPPWPLRDLEKAEKLALEAARQDPNLTLAAQNLSMVYMAQKKKEKARSELNRGLLIKAPTYPWDAELYDWPKMRELLEELKD